MTQIVKELPLPGKVFEVAGRPAFFISPSGVSAGTARGWVWYAPTLPGLPGEHEVWMFRRFVEAGLAIAGIDVGESYGSPAGVRLFAALHECLTRQHGLSTRAALLARSRGGLMQLAWAGHAPQTVACLAGIYPVCSIASYPRLAKASGAYGLSEAELTAGLAEYDPMEQAETLACAGTPIFLLHGDSDTVVPLEANSAELARRCRAAGGSVSLEVVKGGGHDVERCWFECQALVDFVVGHARAAQAAGGG